MPLADKLFPEVAERKRRSSLPAGGSFTGGPGLGEVGAAGQGDEPLLSDEAKRILRNTAMATGGAALAALNGRLAGAPAAVVNTVFRLPGAAAGGFLSEYLFGDNEAAPEEAIRGLAGEGFAQSLGPAARLAGRTGPGQAVRRFSQQAIETRLGQAVRRGSRRIGGPFRSRLEEGAERAQEILEPHDARLTPGQAVNVTTIDRLENLAEASIAGGPRLLRQQERAQGVSQRLLNDFAEGFRRHGSRTERAELVRMTIADEVDAFHEGARALYKEVDRLFGNRAIVDMRPLKLLAISERSKLPLRSQAGPSLTLTRDIERLPNFVDFRTAQSVRSQLLRRVRVGDDPSPDITKGIGKRLAFAADAQIVRAGRRLGGPALQAFREANGFYAKGKQTFNNQLIRRLVKIEEPELLFQMAVRPGRPTNIRRLREAIGGKRDQWEAIQGTFIDDLFEQSLDPATSAVSGRKLGRQLRRFGDEALNEVLGPQGVKNLKELARTAELTQAKAGAAGEGRMLIQLAQGGALVNIASSIVSDTARTRNPAALAIMLGPIALARMLTDEVSVKFLTTGLKAPPGSRQMVAAFGQLMARLDQIGATRFGQSEAEELLGRAPQTPQQRLREDISRAQRARQQHQPTTLERMAAEAKAALHRMTVPTTGNQ